MLRAEHFGTSERWNERTRPTRFDSATGERFRATRDTGERVDDDPHPSKQSKMVALTLSWPVTESCWFSGAMTGVPVRDCWPSRANEL